MVLALGGGERSGLGPRSVVRWDLGLGGSTAHAVFTTRRTRNCRPPTKSKKGAGRGSTDRASLIGPPCAVSSVRPDAMSRFCSAQEQEPGPLAGP
eukprot:3578097-Prymnesium_polylepis.2